MKFYSIVFFLVCLNFAALVLVEMDVFLMGEKLTWQTSSVENIFDWQNLLLTFGVGGAISGIIGLITRQYVYATGAFLIWAVGIMSPVFHWVFDGVPLILGALLPVELAPLQTVVTAFFSLFFFFFIVEIATQRQIT